MSHVPHMDEPCPRYALQRCLHGALFYSLLAYESCLTYKWVMSHVRMKHVLLENESCPNYGWITCLSLLAYEWCPRYTLHHTNERFPTYALQWVLPARCRVSLIMYIRVMSHIWMSHVQYIDKSCATCKCGRSAVHCAHSTLSDSECHSECL